MVELHTSISSIVEWSGSVRICSNQLKRTELKYFRVGGDPGDPTGTPLQTRTPDETRVLCDLFECGVAVG